jgi:taurine dioxygenase
MNYSLHKNGWTVIIDDFDIATATQEDINQIGCLLATNTLVVIKNQTHLTVDDQLRTAHLFGQVESIEPVKDIAPFCHISVPGSNYEIIRVTGELDEHGEPGLFGHVSDLDWHCNMPGDPRRKPLVWLFGITGTAGSRTSWTNNILAYKDLSDEWRERIKDLKMICGWKKGTYSEFDFGRATGVSENYNEHCTPSLVHTNIGNQTGLFFPFLQFKNFVGLTEDESRTIVEELKAHVLQEKYIYHHDWQDGDVVIAEQWLGIHKRWKFDGMPDRILHRITFDFDNINLSSIK